MNCSNQNYFKCYLILGIKSLSQCRWAKNVNNTLTNIHHESTFHQFNEIFCFKVWTGCFPVKTFHVSRWTLMNAESNKRQRTIHFNQQQLIQLHSYSSSFQFLKLSFSVHTSNCCLLRQFSFIVCNFDAARKQKIFPDMFYGKKFLTLLPFKLFLLSSTA